MSDRDADVAALLHKQEITELLTRYLRSVDRLFAGPAADYVDSIERDLTHPRSRTSHNMTNLLIDLDGAVATAESYCIYLRPDQGRGGVLPQLRRRPDDRPAGAPGRSLGHRAPPAHLGLEPRCSRGRALDAGPARPG